jgi:D-threonine aldolase
MTENLKWYAVENISEFDSPMLLIYKDRVASNIQKALHFVQKPQQLRPHVKTHKMKEVTAMLQAAGIQKFKCATIPEAEMLGQMQAEDVLISYPIVGPKIERLQKLRNTYPATAYSCLIDRFETAEIISNAFQNNPISVFIDLNVGMNRTGILPKNALTLFTKCNSLPGVEIKGLHAYDGHIHSKDLGIRSTEASQVAEIVLSVKTIIEKAAGKNMQVVAGGSPTFHLHAEHDPHIEVSPGTFVFWDEGYTQILPDLDFDIAAVLATRVISILNQELLCVDLGHKSIAAENPLPRIKFLDIEATPMSQSEEHLVLKVLDTSIFTLGQVLYGVPIHICPTVALYEKVLVVINNKITESWEVFARDKSLNI